MKFILEMLCFPPGLNLGIALMSLVSWRRWRRVAMILLLGDVALLPRFQVALAEDFSSLPGSLKSGPDLLIRISFPSAATILADDLTFCLGHRTVSRPVFIAMDRSTSVSLSHTNSSRPGLLLKSVAFSRRFGLLI